MTPSGGRSKARTLLLLTVVFFAVTLFYTTSNLFYEKLDPGHGITLRQDFILYAVRWLPWIIFAPVAIELARRFPLRGRRWPGRVALRAGAGLVLATLESLLSFALYRFSVAPLVALPPGEGLHLLDPWLTHLNYLHNNILTYLAILGAVWGLDYLRLYREKELAAGRLETELARANLLALRSQLHPHFLFNTLHMISAVVYQDPGLADRLIGRLSDLLRVTLQEPDAAKVPLRHELEILDLYLEIMKTRFGRRLAISYDIDPETLPALVPSFSLQPIVENAIKHGLLPRAEGGKVSIAARRHDGRLVVRVSDDGPGFGPDPEALLSKGVGLNNIKSRLAGLFGSAGALRLEPGAGGGARVALDIPFETEPAAAAGERRG
jgi:signal transduction histidine kinase